MTFMNRIAGSALVGLALSVAVGTAAADVVAVVSSASPVTTLSKAQVADIFLGKVGRFPNGTSAVAIDRTEGSPTRDEFYVTYAGKSPAQVKSHWAKIIFTGRGQPPKSVSTDSEIKKLIAANPQAIGYLDRSALDASLKVLLQP